MKNDTKNQVNQCPVRASNGVPCEPKSGNVAATLTCSVTEV